MKLILSVMLMPQPTIIGVIVSTEDEVFTSYLHPYSLSTIMNIVVICWYLTFIRSKPTNFNRALVEFNPFKLFSSHIYQPPLCDIITPNREGFAEAEGLEPPRQLITDLIVFKTILLNQFEYTSK